MTGFDAKMRETFINGLCQKYPFTECATIGKSLCGREIRCFKIGSSNNPVLFAAAFHGMEWLTSLLVLIFAEQMSKAYHNNGDINSVKINGKPIDPDKTYRIATIDYLADGGDYMKPLTRATRVAKVGTDLAEDIISYYREGKGRGKKVKPDSSNRFRP